MTTQAEYEIEYATSNGRAALANARATLDRAMAELDHYITRFDEADGLRNKADVLNWALNHLATYIPSNVRLDVIATAQTELIRANATHR